MKESLKKAQLKYRKKLKQINITFYPGEEELYKFIHDLGAAGRKEVFRKAKEKGVD